MIHTKVARIISPTQLVLAAGEDQGVREGMQFVIYENGDPIYDPITGEDLGTLELIKGKVKVHHVQKKLCLATTLARSVNEIDDPYGMIRMALSMKPFDLMQPRTITRKVYDELKVEGAVAVEPDLTVRVGDLARSVD